jgi:hypothetical protein
LAGLANIGDGSAIFIEFNAKIDPRLIKSVDSVWIRWKFPDPNRASPTKVQIHPKPA